MPFTEEFYDRNSMDVLYGGTVQKLLENSFFIFCE